MKTVWLTMIAVAAVLGVEGWAQIILPPSLPSPTTNTLPLSLSVTNDLSVTNVVTATPAVDVSALSQAMEDTDVITKNKVATAIQAIQDGNRRLAARLLREVRAQTGLTPNQGQALDVTLNQLRSQRH